MYGSFLCFEPFLSTLTLSSTLFLCSNDILSYEKPTILLYLALARVNFDVCEDIQIS